jgi:hypothetical protein
VVVLPAVSKVTPPLTGAVQVYQIELSVGPLWSGSPTSSVASMLLPTTLPGHPATTSASAKSSLGGGAAKAARMESGAAQTKPARLMTPTIRCRRVAIRILPPQGSEVSRC